MRKLIEVALLVLATLCMFAFPVLLLGLAPWIGEGLLGMTHMTITHGLYSAIQAIMVMFSSSAGLLLLAMPAFGGILWGLSRALRSTSAPVPVRKSAVPERSQREPEDRTAARSEAPAASRQSSLLRNPAKSGASADAEGYTGPSLPKLRSRRISTPRRSGEEAETTRAR